MTAAFVVWHLAFLFFRNPVSIEQARFDAWVADSAESAAPMRSFARALAWADDAFGSYERGLALDQGWRMFVAPIARTAYFPAVEIVFEDGSRSLLLSDNEPKDVDGFIWRPAAPRLRKHETQIASSLPEEMGLEIYWERYLALRCRDFRTANPGDSRRVKQLVLHSRTYALPEPTSPPTYGKPVTRVIGDMGGGSCNP